MKLTVNDLFCGCGGMGLGFIKSGFEIVGAWDYDKFAAESYKANVDKSVQVKNIIDMTYKDLKKANVWTFGFPCQDLSVAGLKAGLLEGKRSGLFFQVMRLLSETKEHVSENLPEIILAENVKGLKKYIPVLKEQFKKHGYKAYIALLNSKEFGLAQNRERYFIVGVREDIEKEFTFPLGYLSDIQPMILSLEEHVEERFYIDDVRASKAIQQAAVNGLTFPRLGDIRVIADLQHYGNDQMNRVHDPFGLSPTLLTVSGGGRHVKIYERHTKRVRYLTPREYARLQGFPESFEFVVSKAQLYKQFGNAVSVNVSYEMARSIKKFLNAM
ncbi:DNA (cytosine-5)-methyltransferase 1 [Paenibacillus sp. LBL]|uniref:DNA cytosine methyltransferase n=1 Tax=Paenibacillus sp. LBL TaxID=2940563 RepID=UPI002476E022|nr:DNA cytosine methyltransferase [Paenibacillus sp. LBL]MDH6674289.1 DNA (cytosine-5)-methyltransferase 1 [Paenibacillus sp. LBL]